MEKNDEQLVGEYLTGREDSFEVLIEKYLKPLFNFIYRIIGDKDSAEDIVQTVFLKAWENLRKFDRSKKFSTWVFAIAKNEAFDFLKKKKAFSFSAFENAKGENFLEFIEDENSLHGEKFLRVVDNKKEVEKLLNSLSPQTKAILLLHHLHGFSLVEISEIMGSSSNTTKSKYRRAILNLRSSFSFE